MFSAKHESIFILKGISENHMKQIVRHEVTHAYIYCHGVHFNNDSYLEESVCDFIAAKCDLLLDDVDTICHQFEIYIIDNEDKKC